MTAQGRRAGNDRITDWFHTGKNTYCCEADRFVNGIETIIYRVGVLMILIKDVVKLTGL